MFLATWPPEQGALTVCAPKDDGASPSEVAYPISPTLSPPRRDCPSTAPAVDADTAAGHPDHCAARQGRALR